MSCNVIIHSVIILGQWTEQKRCSHLAGVQWDCNQYNITQIKTHYLSLQTSDILTSSQTHTHRIQCSLLPWSHQGRRLNGGESAQTVTDITGVLFVCVALLYIFCYICLHYAHVLLSSFLLSGNTWFMLCEFMWGDGGNVVSEPGGPKTDFCTRTYPLDRRESWWQVSFWSRALIRSLWSKHSGQDHHIRRSQAESGCLPSVCPSLKTTSDIKAHRKIPGAPETQHPNDNKWQLMM